MREITHNTALGLPAAMNEAPLTAADWRTLIGLLDRAERHAEPHRRQTFADANFAAKMQRQEQRAFTKLELALNDELDLEADEEAAWSVRVPSRGGAAAIANTDGPDPGRTDAAATGKAGAETFACHDPEAGWIEEIRMGYEPGSYKARFLEDEGWSG